MDIVAKIAYKDEFIKVNEENVKKYVECKDIFFVSRELTGNELAEISDLYYYGDVKVVLKDFNIIIYNTDHYEEKRDALIIYHNGIYWENGNLEDYDGEWYYSHWDGSNWEHIELENEWDEIPDDSPKWGIMHENNSHSRVYFANDKFYFIEWDDYQGSLVKATIFENSQDGLGIDSLSETIEEDVAEFVPIEKCLSMEKCIEYTVSLLEDEMNCVLEKIDLKYDIEGHNRDFVQDKNEFIIEPGLIKNTQWLSDYAIEKVYDELEEADKYLKAILELDPSYSYGYGELETAPPNFKGNYNLKNELFSNARKLLQWG